MAELWGTFLGYIRIYQPRIIPVLILSVVLGIIFLFLVKAGYTKYTEKPVSTIICGLLLSISIAVVIVMTFYGRTPGDEFIFRLLPFSSYIEAFGSENVEVVLQIIMNVVMFVPIGLFLPCCFKLFEKDKSVLLTALISSGSIELIQGLARLGMFETDDILGNVMGAEIGCLIWSGISKGIDKWKK